MEWALIEELEGPLGRTRNDYNAAMIAVTIANSALTRRKKAFTLKDFLLRWNGKGRGRKSDEDMSDFLKGLTIRMGGKINDDEHRQAGPPD